MTSADALQSLITLLNSPRSNDEMQNDLFELLGFDKFEFIQEILEHRQDITDSLKTPVQPSIAESMYLFNYLNFYTDSLALSFMFTCYKQFYPFIIIVIILITQHFNFNNYYFKFLVAAMLPENKMPQYLCQVSVRSEQEKMLAKIVRKGEKKSKIKKADDDDEEPEINIAQLRAKR